MFYLFQILKYTGQNSVLDLLCMSVMGYRFIKHRSTWTKKYKKPKQKQLNWNK